MQVAIGDLSGPTKTCRAWIRQPKLVRPRAARIGGIPTMQWSNGQPFGRPPVHDRLRLRRAALRYAAHGWEAIRDPGRAGTGVSGVVLLLTGQDFDVLEVPAAVGLHALGTA